MSGGSSGEQKPLSRVTLVVHRERQTAKAGAELRKGKDKEEKQPQGPQPYWATCEVKEKAGGVAASPSLRVTSGAMPVFVPVSKTRQNELLAVPAACGEAPLWKVWGQEHRR